MRVGILGRVTIWDDDGEEIAMRPQVRRLLALLVTAEGTVSADRIREYIADGRHGGSAARTAAGRLRSMVAERLVTVGSGYELVLAPPELDAAVFEEIRVQSAGAGASDRIDLLAAALQLWRGSALGDVAGESWASPTAIRLDQRRADTVEDLADACSNSGAGNRRSSCWTLTCPTTRTGSARSPS